MALGAEKETMNPDSNRGSGLIVVGVDSSPEAKEALRFALQEAKLRQATLRVVHAWQFGYIGASGIEGASPVVGGDLGELRHTAALALDATLYEVVPHSNGVAIERRVVEGAPAAVLVDESRRADLLVVGSRGHGRLRALARVGEPAVRGPCVMPSRDRASRHREVELGTSWACNSSARTRHRRKPTAIACSSTGFGLAASRTSKCASTSGPESSHRVASCGNGSAMTQPASPSSAADTESNSKRKRRNFRNFARARTTAHSPSSTEPVIASTTMPSCSQTLGRGG